MTTHTERLARLPEAEPPTPITPAPPRSLAELRADQLAAWEAAEAAAVAAAAEQRRRYPDAQWDGPALMMTGAEFDPGPAEQQAFADRYRAEHPGADLLRHRHPGDTSPTTELDEALFVWRKDQATAAWQRAATWWTQTPPCAVCGESTDGETMTIVGQTRPVCGRCGPSVQSAMAAHVAAEPVGDGGRTRAEAAAELVDSLLTREPVAS